LADTLDVELVAPGFRKAVADTVLLRRPLAEVARGYHECASTYGALRKICQIRSLRRGHDDDGGKSGHLEESHRDGKATGSTVIFRIGAEWRGGFRYFFLRRDSRKIGIE
jgi:hypothetical protein